MFYFFKQRKLFVESIDYSNFVFIFPVILLKPYLEIKDERSFPIQSCIISFI